MAAGVDSDLLLSTAGKNVNMVDACFKLGLRIDAYQKQMHLCISK